MIQHVHLMYYPAEDAYRDICGHIGLSSDAGRPGSFIPDDPDTGIRKLLPYRIEYKGHGVIWFLHAHLFFPAFGCEYAAFPGALHKAFAALLGEPLAKRLPAYDTLCCDYIEYAGHLAVTDADATLSRLSSSGKFVPEQLSRDRWDAYHKPHATIEFCLDKLDATHLQALARAHGTALKRRMPSSMHKTVGLLAPSAVNADTEAAILGWLYQKNGV